MLHLHHADELEPLLAALADLLVVPPADPFTPDVVMVPAAGMSDAVMVALGRRLGVSALGAGDGVVANIDFLFPGRFLARALGDATRGDDPEGDPWRLPRLTWAVLDELADGSIDVPRPGGAKTDRWALARRIADLFDRYATQRPQLITAWAEGRDTDGTFTGAGPSASLDSSFQWQADLWRAVRRRIGTPSPPEQLPHLLDALRRGEIQPTLPERVSVFGVGSVPSTMLAVLRALGATRDVHVFLRHPSQAAWSASPHRLAGTAAVRTLVDVTSHVRHPLLVSWGRPSLEARTLLAGLPDVAERVETGTAASAEPPTLLGALQRGIRLDEAPTLQPGVDPADGTVQLHACHGEVRQLEALRDALGHAFVADPTLTAHDVLVLCPDLERFAPLVEAVFARGAFPVPVRIGDRSLTTDDPLIGAVQAVIALASGRASLSEVLALAQFEPIRARFGWTVDQVEQIALWCATLGTRWGLSADHRTDWGLPDTISTGTWRSTIDQLLAGAAISAPSPRAVLGDVSPYDDLGTEDLLLVGTLADLLARLVDLHAELQHGRPVGEWVELFRGVVDGFCAVAPADAWRRQDILRQLDDITVAAGGSTIPLTLADARALLADTLQDRPGRLRLRSGAVTVSSLVPQHGVPARIVCVLGLDDGALRGGTFDGDDVLGAHPCVGERHPRHESRQLLLDAVLAAQDRLIITCTGADLTTNKELPFIVPVVELLDVVATLAPLDRRLAPVVVRHPRHGFDERVLVPGALQTGAMAPFTFDTTMLAAARAKRRAEEVRRAATVATGSPWALPPVLIERLDVDELLTAVTAPAKAYLHDRLDVRLPREAAEVDDGLPISVDPLRASSLGRGLLDTRRRGDSADHWLASMRFDGALPPGELRTTALLGVRTEVEQLVDAVARFGVPLRGTDEVVVDQTVRMRIGDGEREVRIEGLLGGVAAHADGPRLVLADFTRPRPSHRLAAAVRVALAQRQQPDVEWSAVVVRRGESGTEPTARRVRLRGAGDERLAHADALVTFAVELCEWARRDAVPLFDHSSFALADGDVGQAANKLEEDTTWGEAALLWPEITVDSLLRDPILPNDPPGVVEWGGVAKGCRAAAVAHWVWGTYRACVEELDA